MMNMIITHDKAQSTKHKAQSTKHKAQSTKHKAQSTKHNYNYVLNLSSKSYSKQTKKIYKNNFVVIDVLKSVLANLEILFTQKSSSNKNNFTHEENFISSHTNYVIDVVDFSHKVNNVYNKNLFKGEFNMNKKFLKSLAALFAVAVLGVSCSSNPNDPNNTNTQEEKPVAIGLKNTKDGDGTQTTVGQKFTSATTVLGPANATGFVFKVNKDVSSSDKYEVSVIGVKGIKKGNEAGAIQDKTQATSDTLGSTFNAFVTLDALTAVSDGKLKLANIDVSVQADSITLKLKETDDGGSKPLATQLKSLMGTTKNFGVIEFKIKVQEKSKPKTATTLTVYAEIGTDA